MRPGRCAVGLVASVLSLAGFVGSASAQDGGVVEPLRISPGTGDASTPFRLELPDGATCPGDSANDGYRVSTFLVPAELDPFEVRYDGLGPAAWSVEDGLGFRQPLFDTDTNSIASLQTAEAEAPGKPGRLLPLPSFSFGVYEPGELPEGAYAIGVVCTRLNEIERLWGTQIELSGTEVGGPLRWTVTGPQLDDDGGGRSPAAVILPVLLAAGSYFFLVRRRRARSATSLLEDR